MTLIYKDKPQLKKAVFEELYNYQDELLTTEHQVYHTCKFY